MPGIVVFRRRWSVGSDDLVVPTIFLIVLHSAWVLALILVIALEDFDESKKCTVNLHNLLIGHIIILSICLIVELAIALISNRGTILAPSSRASIEYLLYGRIAIGVADLTWLIIGAVWVAKHYTDCSPDTAKKALIGVMACNWLMIFASFISLWCTFDTAGRKWVKMKRYQDTMKERRKDTRRGTNRRQSGSRRNWRQRKAFRAYEESWDRRFQLLCCCVERKGHNKSSMSEIAALFTDFFRDLDVVPSDVVAGLVLLRKHQQQRMELIISRGSSDVYQYLSGVPISPRTQFLQLSQPDILENYQKTVRFMRFALAAYGWPVYMMMYPATWMCRLIPMLRCCCCRKQTNQEVVDDNCCMCNYNTAKKISGLSDVDLVYATYHVDIGETPFFVAVDNATKSVVVAIRGTLSLQDVLTDLKAEPERLPLDNPRDDWQGHKGMTQAAVYIKNKLIDGRILDTAMERNMDNHSAKYNLVLVGHSLGAGTAAILSILLHDMYPSLHCYSYSPPGGLLTLPCVQATKSFITSIVVGKDCVPRIGLPQLEVLRTDILNQIKMTSDSKWNIISQGLMCCNGKSNTNTVDMQERVVRAHPCNSAIGLSAHIPLYPPGQVIHVVRSHLPNSKKGCKSSEPIYQAVWANNGDFDEVLVSPTMVSDHMPANVLDALERVVMKVAPEKPCHTLTEEERREMLNRQSTSSLATPCSSRSFPNEPQCYVSCENGYPITTSNSAATTQENSCIEEEKRNLVFPNNSFYNDFVSGKMSQSEEVAPLASPETISMSSGVGTASHDSFRSFSNRHRDPESLAQTQPLLSMVKEHSAHNDNNLVEFDSGHKYSTDSNSGNTISVEAEIGSEFHRNQNKPDLYTHTSSSNCDNIEDLSADNSASHCQNNKDLSAFEPQACLSLEGRDTQNNDTGWITSELISKGSGDKADEANTKMPNGNEVVGADNNADDKTLSSSYFHHVPSKNNQMEYGHPNVYYTQGGGMGFPYNSYHISLDLKTDVDQETEIIL